MRSAVGGKAAPGSAGLCVKAAIAALKIFRFFCYFFIKKSKKKSLPSKC